MMKNLFFHYLRDGGSWSEKGMVLLIDEEPVLLIDLGAQLEYLKKESNAPLDVFIEIDKPECYEDALAIRV